MGSRQNADWATSELIPVVAVEVTSRLKIEPDTGNRQAMRNTAIITKAALLIGVLITAGCSDTTPLSPPPDTEADNTIAENCTADHPFVGRTRQLSMLDHGVAGTVLIKDDCTIEVSDFFYDGGGPSVYFYGGQNLNYIGANAFSIGPLLSGTAWEGDTITLAIPEGKTLDDFDSISVWCFDFNANFGDAFFGDV